MFDLFAWLMAVFYGPSLIIVYFYSYKTGYKKGVEIKLLNLLSKRAFIFNCSYKTAWDRYISEIEKEGFTFDEVMEGYHGS